MKFRFFLIVSITLLSVSVLAQKISKTKYAKGISYMPKDSSFYVKFGLRMQNLLVVDFPENGPMKSTFMTRRFRLKFDGWILSPRLVYKMEIGQSNLDVGNGSNLLLDAVVKYNMVENLWLWFGQTKLPGNRERVVSSQKLETVDRSAVNSYYNIDRDIGIQLRHKISLGSFVIKEVASVSTGEGRNYTLQNQGGYCYTGRLEFLLFGEFIKKGDYFMSDLIHEPKPKLAVGFTYDLNDLAVRSRGQRGAYNDFKRSISSVMADLMFKYKGLAFFSEFIHRETEDPFGTREKMADTSVTGYFETGYGWNNQVSYTTKKGWMAVVRVTNIRPHVEIKKPDFNQYTFGMGKYIVNHKLKVLSDISYFDYFGGKANSTMWRFTIELGL